MVAQDQFKVTMWGQGTWSQVGIITWKQCRHINLLQGHRDEKDSQRQADMGRGARAPLWRGQGVGRGRGKPVLRSHRDRKRDAVVP